MKRKNYIFTNRRHSKRAIMATILGIISNSSLVIVLYLSYLSGGAVPLSYGLTGLLAAVFSMTGLILGVVAVRDKDTFKFFPVVGTFLNLAALGILVLLVQLAY
ncbi:MAG: hypothetical protein K2O32_09760 [Acetatifactor sp.]|nr:hypothetical protein [Acetatifactor sp.]